MTYSRIDASRLSVLLDLRHPLACLALHPAIEFGRSLDIDINWLPLTIPNLNAPTPPAPGDDRGTRHRRYRARAIAREIETYGKAQGLALRDLYRDGDAAAANLGWLWVREHSPDRLTSFLAELFRGYWSLDLDASSREQVARGVDAVEADGGAFLDWCGDDGSATAEVLAAELRDRGLYGVPAYVVGDEVFYGRQHLPMIRWIMDGRVGPVPI